MRNNRILANGFIALRRLILRGTSNNHAIRRDRRLSSVVADFIEDRRPVLRRRRVGAPLLCRIAWFSAAAGGRRDQIGPNQNANAEINLAGENRIIRECGTD